MNTPPQNQSKKGAPEKALEAYLVSPPQKGTSLTGYLTAPATAFLLHVCEAHDAFVHCLNKFTKRKDGSYNVDSADCLHHISLALAATTMGHFETFQKGLFAGLFERSRFFPRFILKAAAKELNSPTIDVARLAAYRGLTAPVGLTVADALSGWHSPKTVNAHFRALGLQQAFFSNDETEQLELLWQLRHSIVHTGAFLTLPDSQKVKRLEGRGDRAIAFDNNFINALSRRLHKIVKSSTVRLQTAATAQLGPNPAPSTVDDFSAFFAVTSPKSAWL